MWGRRPLVCQEVAVMNYSFIDELSGPVLSCTDQIGGTDYIQDNLNGQLQLLQT